MYHDAGRAATTGCSRGGWRRAAQWHGCRLPPSSSSGEWRQAGSAGKRRSLPSGTSLRLGVAAEMVVVDPPYSSLDVSEMDGLRDTLLDLSEGRIAEGNKVETLHHYINASSHEIFLRFDREVTVLLRGEWK